MVRSSFVEYLSELQATDDTIYGLESRGNTKRINVSDLGSCLRKPFLRLAEVESADWIDDYLMELFFNGNLWEREILKSLSQYRPATQVRVRDDVFSGKIDALITHGSSIPIIVEIKDTADHNFRAKDRLPYLHHCYQVLAYEVLLRKKWNHDGPIKCILYYHGRSQWAEFVVSQEEWGISAVGDKNGVEAEVPFLDADIIREMNNFRHFYGSDNVPSKYETPFTERFACTKTAKGYVWPACQYIEHCWPELADHPAPWDSNLWYDDCYHTEEQEFGQD